MAVFSPILVHSERPLLLPKAASRALRKPPGLRPGPEGKDFGDTRLTTGGFLRATRFLSCATAVENAVALRLFAVTTAAWAGGSRQASIPPPSCVGRGGVISTASLLCSANGRTGAAQEGPGHVKMQEPTSGHLVLTLGLSWGVWGGHSLARQRMVPHGEHSEGPAF